MRSAEGLPSLARDESSPAQGIPNGGFVSIHSKDIEEFMQPVLRKDDYKKFKQHHNGKVSTKAHMYLITALMGSTFSHNEGMVPQKYGKRCELDTL
ncbi:Hypothetical predicted protein [Octopus vulgaris]|uniref:Uncharacterized protein n=1 Tax=Octopus vulgaris TaxID=6645 RepID=A0AA36C109_OCTVU|nr:Hypothetical predicted protein [Octopus vulgaris]